jgi:hypothetical protein
MAIQVDCACGKKLQARDELLGKRVKCPGCGGIVTVESILDAIPVESEVDERVAFAPVGTTARPFRAAAPPSDLDDNEVIRDRVGRRPRGIPPTPPNFWATGPGQVAGGLVLLLGGVVWLVGGLFLGLFFRYPIFLILGGIFGTIKGLIECARRKPEYIDGDDDEQEDDDD